MKVTGITAEYNPLHNGHVYHMEQAKSITGADALVVSMSGNFVQRGEPAVFDKWTRAELALRCGADLVVEIPVAACLSDASGYAAASVRMLEALGADCIAYGSECGDAQLLRRTAAFIRSEKESFDEGIAKLTREGMSYPAARAEVYRRARQAGADGQALEEELSALSNPNDILALSYLMHMERAEAVAVKREGAPYHSMQASDGDAFRSAQYLREVLRREGSRSAAFRKNVPECVAEAAAGIRPVFADDFFDLLRYALMSRAADDLEECPSGGEGLSNLLRSSARSASDLDDLIKRAKSRRYTYTRISRLCMQILLGIDRRKHAGELPMYLRVLGFNETGRALLSEIKKREDAVLPVITNINKEAASLSREAQRMLELDVYASDLYSLAAGREIRSHSDHVRMPVII